MAFVAQLWSEDAVHVQAEATVQQLITEGNVFALVSHQFWGVWSLIQARYSAIDFDYMEYSSIRWNEYHKRKAEFCSLWRESEHCTS